MKKRIPNKNKKELILNSITDFNLEINEEIYSKIAVFLDSNKNKFVSIGRLEPLKNYENILKAFQRIKDSGIDFKYVIFGQGFLEPKLKNLISKYDLENNVLLVGGVKGAKEYLNLFDYFILCSIHEGFPNSLIEAMSKKLLPFVTDAGDSFDIIGNNRGIKIDGTEPENIASSIVSFIETKNKKRKEDIFINIENYLNTELNPDNIINKWIKLTE